MACVAIALRFWSLVKAKNENLVSYENKNTEEETKTENEKKK